MTEPAETDGLFGRLAVHMGFLTLEQLTIATAAQQNASAQRPIGEVLTLLGFTTAEQVQQVLKRQADVLAVRRGLAEGQNSTKGASSVPRPTFDDAPTLSQVIRGPITDTGTAKRSRVDGNLARSWTQQMLAAAVAEGASDVHFHAEERVRMRIHGRLMPVSDRSLPAQVTEAALRALLSPADVMVLDRDGHVDCGLTLDGIGRFRVNVYRQQHGIDGVFRVVKREPPHLAELGLKSELARLTAFHQGIVLCTGPTGSGKTSTMAALVRIINEERADHIITIEDPIEILHPSARCIVSQRQVGKHTAAFQRALKSALREDPDVIVIGEMRDRETASLALTAAETGHLVLATLHTHSAVRTINRIIGEFPPSQQPTVRAMLSESLRAVVSQRLLPHKDGRGMVPAVEVLHCTPAVAHLIREGRTHQIKSVMQTGQVHGMQLLDDALKALVQAGAIDGNEALRHADDPRAFLGGAVPGAVTMGRIDIAQLPTGGA